MSAVLSDCFATSGSTSVDLQPEHSSAKAGKSRWSLRSNRKSANLGGVPVHVSLRHATSKSTPVDLLGVGAIFQYDGRSAKDMEQINEQQY